MSEYQRAFNYLHRSISELDRYERGTYGRRAAIGDLTRAIDNLVIARVREILADKSMEELLQLAKEIDADNPKDKSA